MKNISHVIDIHLDQCFLTFLKLLLTYDAKYFSTPHLYVHKIIKSLLLNNCFDQWTAVLVASKPIFSR